MMASWADKEQSAAYARLGEMAAETLRSGERINRNRERDGMVSVLDEAQEVHAAFSAVASLAESALENDIERLRGGDLAALLRVINGRLGRAIDVAYAASQGDGGSVVAFRD